MTLPVPLKELPTPALLLDRARLEANLAGMAADGKRAGVALRPHFKTSKSLDVARSQLAAGAIGFTAATPAEVAALLSIGVTDILWAHQAVGPAKVAFAVANPGVTLSIDSVEVARPLSDAAVAAGVTLTYCIEVDTGLGRSGVLPGAAIDLATALAALPGLQLRGVFTHEGHLSKHFGDRAALESAGQAAGASIVEVADSLRAAGFPISLVSVGSTPGASSTPFVDGVTEARAGTYIYYDANQVALETVPRDRCALTVLARVVTRRADGVAIIDAGVKAMSSDTSVTGRGLGWIADDIQFEMGNEEHGFLTGPGAAGLAVGDLVRIIPNHACGTVNMWSGYHVVDDSHAVAFWPTVARH